MWSCSGVVENLDLKSYFTRITLDERIVRNFLGVEFLRSIGLVGLGVVGFLNEIVGNAATEKVSGFRWPQPSRATSARVYKPFGTLGHIRIEAPDNAAY